MVDPSPASWFKPSIVQLNPQKRWTYLWKWEKAKRSGNIQNRPKNKRRSRHDWHKQTKLRAGTDWIRRKGSSENNAEAKAKRIRQEDEAK